MGVYYRIKRVHPVRINEINSMKPMINKTKHQSGVGLVEVMVAVVLLSIGVLGFVALQLRATAASVDAGKLVQASVIAQDLSERMRVNRLGQAVYASKDGYSSGQTFSSTGCASLTASCTPNDMAAFDFLQVKSAADALGMKLAVVTCPNMTFSRKCILVSWDDTTPTIATSNSSTNACVTSTSTYVAGARCLLMETY